MSGPTREQVMAWAQHVGMAGMITDVVTTIDEIERFAALAYAAGQAAEREACAKVCDGEAARALFNWRSDVPSNQQFWNGAEQLVSGCAAAIRARGQK